MQNPVIERLIRVHQQSVELCRTLLTDGLKGTQLTDEQIAAIKDDEGCEFARVLQSGTLRFDGVIAEGALIALHATFHSLASLILTLVMTRAESSEIGSYVTALNNVSNQMITLLKAARVRSD